MAVLLQITAVRSAGQRRRRVTRGLILRFCPALYTYPPLLPLLLWASCLRPEARCPDLRCTPKQSLGPSPLPARCVLCLRARVRSFLFARGGQRVSARRKPFGKAHAWAGGSAVQEDGKHAVREPATDACL
jgi:hypothetical protein